MGILDELAGDALGRPVVLPDPQAGRLRAAFRDVDFWVESTDDVLGRRQAVHEFPVGDGEDDRPPFAEDLGPVTGKFTINAFLIGPDVSADRVLLEDALRKRGPGTLIHPERGELNVSVNGEVRVRWSTTELEKLAYSIPFVVTGEQPQPAATFGLDADVGAKADIVNALIVGGADDLLDISGPGFLSDDVVAAMNDAIGLIQSVNATISGQIGIVDAASRSITNFAGELTTLVSTPATLATSLQGLVNSILTGVQSVTNAVQQYDRGDTATNRTRVAVTGSGLTLLASFGGGLDPITEATATQERQAANQAFVKDLVECAALSETARAMSRLPFESVNQAEASFDAIEAVFEQVLARGTVTDDVDAALRDLRVSMTRYIERTTTYLGAITNYTPAVATPLMLIAHNVHGDATRDGEIALRNDVEYPGCAPALRPLEVLVS